MLQSAVGVCTETAWLENWYPESLRHQRPETVFSERVIGCT